VASDRLADVPLDLGGTSLVALGIQNAGPTTRKPKAIETVTRCSNGPGSVPPKQAPVGLQPVQLRGQDNHPACFLNAIRPEWFRKTIGNVAGC
jgi:hypothetical protein